MTTRLVDLIPFRLLIIGAVAFGLAWIGFSLRSDLAVRHVELVERHTVWICIHLCFIFSGLAMLIALYEEEDSSGLRRWLFKLTGALLEVVLISAIIAFVRFSIKDGVPPLHWQRVGGTLSDWVIDFVCIFPLLTIGAILNLIAIFGSSDRISE